MAPSFAEQLQELARATLEQEGLRATPGNQAPLTTPCFCTRSGQHSTHKSGWRDHQEGSPLRRRTVLASLPQTLRASHAPSSTAA
jgi:hypothetical protein